MKRFLGAVLGLTMLCLIGCDDVMVASSNLSREADNFRIYRRILFINGITGEHLLSIEGFSSVEFFQNKFVVTIKKKDGTYLKHYLGKADNVFPMVEQIESKYVSDSHYKITYKPSAIIPNMELR